MYKDRHCRWCGGEIMVIEQYGRPTPLDRRTRKRHQCNERTIGSSLVVPLEIMERRGYIRQANLSPIPQSESRSIQTSLILWSLFALVVILAVVQSLVFA